MAMKKAQQEEKAKGLIGLKKGKKVAGAPYSVGNFKRKSLNLKDKQLGAAGRKAAAVRGGVKVPISSTRYDTTTKKVYGPAGKLLTGRVNLGGGNIGVYRNGVRVTAKKQPVPSGGGGGTNTPTRTGLTTGQKADAARYTAQAKAIAAGKTGGVSNAAVKPGRKRGAFVGGPTSMDGSIKPSGRNPGQSSRSGDFRQIRRNGKWFRQERKNGLWVDLKGQ